MEHIMEEINKGSGVMEEELGLLTHATSSKLEDTDLSRLLNFYSYHLGGLRVVESVIVNLAAARKWAGLTVAALHHSWTSATSGLRGLFLITCRQNFFVCEAPSGARPSAVADVADA
ncbi:hypothetical protein EVAR_53816_1 [Eumeta japonica]|uniref:Uncharacterized protein n=1 Tax=Eumeta variegata TaxID=151549 RepID=A0A4C1YPX1_EUMVA|nr:hypothetical protein EVAR_53816_1 [Eumeta japonica]